MDGTYHPFWDAPSSRSHYCSSESATTPLSAGMIDHWTNVMNGLFWVMVTSQMFISIRSIISIAQLRPDHVAIPQMCGVTLFDPFIVTIIAVDGGVAISRAWSTLNSSDAPPLVVMVAICYAVSLWLLSLWAQLLYDQRRSKASMAVIMVAFFAVLTVDTLAFLQSQLAAVLFSFYLVWLGCIAYFTIEASFPGHIHRHRDRRRSTSPPPQPLTAISSVVQEGTTDSSPL